MIPLVEVAVMSSTMEEMYVTVSTLVHRLGSQNNIAHPTTRALRAQGTFEAVGRRSISCRCFVLSGWLAREGT